MHMFELIIIIYISIVFSVLFGLLKFTEILDLSDNQKVLILILIVFWPVTLFLIFLVIIILGIKLLTSPLFKK